MADFLARRWAKRPKSARRVNRLLAASDGIVFFAYQLAPGVWYDAAGGGIGVPASNDSREIIRRPVTGLGEQADGMMRPSAEGGHVWFPERTGLDALAGPLTIYAECSPYQNGVATDIFQSGESSGGMGIWLRLDDAYSYNNSFTLMGDNSSRAESDWNLLGADFEQRAHRVAISLDGSNARFFASGRHVYTRATSWYPTAHANRRTRICGSYGGTLTNSACGLVVAWNRPISTAEYVDFFHRQWEYLGGLEPIIYSLAAAGGDETAALTGASSVSSAGTLAPAQSIAIAGSESASAAGTLAPLVEYTAALTGDAVSVSAGTVALEQSIAVAGYEVGVSAGALTATQSVAVAGSEVTAAADAVAVTSAQALAGSESATSAGTVAPGSVVAVAGSEATTAAGTVTPTQDGSVGLTGSAATTDAGTVAPESSVALSGAAVTVAAGTLSVSIGADVTVALTGDAVTVSAGSLVSGLALGLSGAESTTNDGDVAGYFDLGLTGIAVSGLAGSVSPSGGGSVALAGLEVTTDAGTLGTWIGAGAGARASTWRGTARQSQGRPAHVQTAGRPKQRG